MEEKLKKYGDLEQKAQVIKGVGEGLLGLIQSNNRSIEWYENRVNEVRSANPDADVDSLEEVINQLVEENKIIAKLEEKFWAEYVF